MTDTPAILADLSAAEARAEWCQQVLNTAPDRFDAGKQIARRLGALVDGEQVEFGFWTPELQDWRIADGDVFLEVLRPQEELDLTASQGDVRFDRVLLPVARCEAFTFAAATGLRAGSRDQIGDFYALVYRDQEGAYHRILDPLASSLPYGAFSPAEIYDLPAMQARRQDKGYFCLLYTSPSPRD